MTRIESLRQIALMILDILRSDRDVLSAAAGFTGEGKSCFLFQLLKEYAKLSNTYFGMDRLTWSRKELMRWIDGDAKGVRDVKTGLKPGQVPEYSCLFPDELWLLYYKRNWFQESQIESLATLNMFRDRHLFVCGGVPLFWDLDGAFLSRVRFYFYIPKRGVCWMFEQENNPFSGDPWNRNQNKIFFRKMGNPFALPNFVCEIHYEDWTDREKAAYYAVRNEKRVKAVDDAKMQQRDKYQVIRWQRDQALRIALQSRLDLFMKLPGKVRREYGVKRLTYIELADQVGMSEDAIKLIFGVDSVKPPSQ